MNLQKTGRFIAQRRQVLGYTQRTLAQRLAVTDKAVSRWETGKGFPDASLLEPLATALEVTISELVLGEALPPQEAAHRTDRAWMEVLRYGKEQAGRSLRWLLLLVGAGSVAGSWLFSATQGTSPMLWVGAALLAASVLLFCRLPLRRWSARLLGSRRRALAAAAAVLGLGLLLTLAPSGVVLRFAAPPPEPPHTVTYSYWSLMPLGYGNIFPLLTVAGLLLLLAVTLLGLWVPSHPLQQVRFVVGCLVLLCLALPLLLFGWEEFTLPTAGILLSLLLSLLLGAWAETRP